MNPSAQSQAAALISALRYSQLVTFLDVASTAVYVYDYLLTLDQEVELVWQARWNVTKILYLATRYLPFVDVVVVLWHQVVPNMSLSDCVVTYKINGWMITIGIFLAEAILTLRTWAVWHRHPYLTIAMPTLATAILISALVVIALYLDSLRFVLLPIPDFKGCFVSGGDTTFLWWSFVLLTGYEGVMLLLMAVRAYQQFREVPVGSSRLAEVVLKDGIIYYIYLFAISVLNVVLIRSLAHHRGILLSLFERNMHSILSCRVITNIRAQAKRQVIFGSSATIGDLGTVSAFQVSSRPFSSGTDEEG